MAHLRRSALRVYFHLRSAHDVILDPEGVEVSNLQEARVQAIRAMEELRHEDAAAAREWSGWTLTVADASGTILFSLNLDGDNP
jgi:hypothetical protein